MATEFLQMNGGAEFTLPLERVLEDHNFNVRIFYGDIDQLAIQLMTEGSMSRSRSGGRLTNFSSSMGTGDKGHSPVRAGFGSRRSRTNISYSRVTTPCARRPARFIAASIRSWCNAARSIRCATRPSCSPRS